MNPFFFFFFSLFFFGFLLLPFSLFSWLEQCETYFMQDGRFAGDICVPWDTNYQTLLKNFLDALGAEVGSHSALAGVHFTTPVMTNGFEWHFRVSYDDFVAKTSYPGDTAFVNSLTTIYGLFNAAFPSKRIVWEAGHTQFLKLSGAKAEWNTAELVYDFAVANNGASRIGLAAWNCAERSFADGGEAFVLQNLFVKAGTANVPLGCQTIGNFVNTPCRFTNTAISLDYGPMEAGTTVCQTGFDVSTTNQVACSNTLNWFKGVRTFASAASSSVAFKGTWVESWSNDLAWNNPTCNAAINLFQVGATTTTTDASGATTTPAAANRHVWSFSVLLFAFLLLLL
jgi:hypothetical protein